MDEFTANFKHLFTPHHTNNHRPRILHPEMLVAMIMVLFVIFTGIRITSSSYPGVLGYATNITVEDLLVYTNNERTQQGLSTLKLNTSLSQAAELKARDMFEDDYWAHIAPDGATPWDFIVSSGYAYSFAGENLARDFSTSENVVKAWMDSPSHRENVLRTNYEDIGFALVNGTLNGSETTLVVQMFGTPQSHEPVVGSAATNISNNVAMQIPTPVISLAIPPVQSANIEEVYAAESIQKPIINRQSMQKSIALIVMGVLLGVLLIDGLLIWKRHTVRIAGHNFAHIIFIVSLISIVLLSSRGSILSAMQ